MRSWHRILALALLYASLPIFLVLTNPERLPLPALWVPFILLFLIIFTVVRRRLRSGAGQKKRLSIAMVAAAIPVLLLVLASIDQLTIRDTIISVSLVVGVTWYLNRIDV